MTFGKALSCGGAIFRRNFKNIVGTAILAYLFVLAALFVVSRAIRMTAAALEPIAYWHSLSIVRKFWWVAAFPVVVWLPPLMTYAASAWIALAETQNAATTFRGTATSVFRRLPMLVAVAVLVGETSLIGFVLLFVPALIVTAIGTTIVPEIIIGKHSFGVGMRAGIRAGWKNVWPLIALLLLAIVAWTVLEVVVFAPIVGEWSPRVILPLAILLAAFTSSCLGCVASTICLDEHRG